MTLDFDREWVDPWAYDLEKKVIRKGEIWDVDVINQSIEMILGTIWGERLFNPSFGCGLQMKIFETVTEDSGEEILNEIANALKRWEDRITVLETEMRLYFNEDAHTLVLMIPYIINERQIKSTFKKKIIV
jgi:phage baseplate assembly protein W